MNLIPTIALGIPGNVAAALLIGAFMILTAFFIWHFGFRSRAKSAGINALNPSSD